MTLVQTQQHPARPRPVVLVASSAGTDTTDVSGPRICDDMTVEVALSVMAGARVGYLLLCDQDEQVTGSVSRAQLAVVRDSPAYTDRTRVRDVLGADGPFAVPVATRSGAGHAVRYREPGARSVVAGGRGLAPGLVALSC